MSPIRLAKIGEKTVRFYSSLHDGPDLPWVAFADVLALALLPESYAEQAQDQWRRVEIAQCRMRQLFMALNALD